MQNTLTTTLPLEQQPLVAPDFSAPTSALPTRPFIARASDGLVMEFPGEKGLLLVPSSKTAGRITVGSIEVSANGGPPPHLHNDEEEIFMVQSGTIEFFCNGHLTQGHAGDVVYLERGEAHRFRGLESDEPNHFNTIIAPGGFEEFFARWVPLLQKGAPDPAEAAALCGEYGITLYPSDAAAPIVENQKSKIIRAGEAPVLSVLGAQVSILLRAEETGGRYSLVRVEGPRDSGPPAHIHDREDELFIVEAGEIEFTLGNEKVLAHKGDVVWGPRGWVHTFRIVSERAQFMNWMTPGGFEGFFVNCHAMEAAGTINPDAVVALSEQFGLTYVPPAG